MYPNSGDLNYISNQSHTYSIRYLKPRSLSIMTQKADFGSCFWCVAAWGLEGFKVPGAVGFRIQGFGGSEFSVRIIMMKCCTVCAQVQNFGLGLRAVNLACTASGL